MREDILAGREMMEQFAIPGVGGIIVQQRDGMDYLLLQERSKRDAPQEDGLFEIPAGKIRAFESVYNALRREITEETGLTVTEIIGEDTAPVYDSDDYQVINFKPFNCCQNIKGYYPIMVFVFICRVEGELLESSDEARNFTWVPVNQLEAMLTDNPKKFYPMHVETLKKYVAARLR